ncbi:DUF3899 domain-containing protein [Neobacillus drentensis]|uniref:DUF3899 domain-containing protein n=1 Tax=Neobacillus drentensis TaxID=220684 RepID=UPI0030010C40
MKKLIPFLLTTLVWIVIKKAADLSLVDLINHSFLAGIISLLAGACFVIFQSGFLSLFFHGFRTLGSFATPRSRAMERVDQLVSEDEGWQHFKNKLAGQMALSSFLIGFSSIAVSLVGLVLY